MFRTIDFTQTAELAPGDYTISVGLNNLGGGGAYAIYDGVTLEGVPEPGSAMLLSIAGFGLLRRRR